MHRMVVVSSMNVDRFALGRPGLALLVIEPPRETEVEPAEVYHEAHRCQGPQGLANQRTQLALELRKELLLTTLSVSSY